MVADNRLLFDACDDFVVLRGPLADRRTAQLQLFASFLDFPLSSAIPVLVPPSLDLHCRVVVHDLLEPWLE